MKKLLKLITDQGEKDTQMRDMVFRISRDIQRMSKAAIYALHREEVAEARIAIAKAEKDLVKMYKVIKGTRFAYDANYLGACEEFLESFYLMKVFQHKSLDVFDGFPVSYDQYGGALADVTGELVRRAVNIAGEKTLKELIYFKSISEELVSAMARMFLTGHLRQKFDEAKRNLHKIEEIIYGVRRIHGE